MTMTTARLIDDDAPQRAPDGEVGDGAFYFWLGDDGVEDEDGWDADETPMAYDELGAGRVSDGDGNE